MGAERTAESHEGDFVLDAGALIAYERGDQRVRAVAEQSAELKARLVVPASVLAQVWRGGSRSASLTKLIAGAESDSLDEPRAKEVGERLGSRGASDIADAHVVCCALEHQAAVITSDRTDMEALTGSGERLTLIPV